MTMVLSIEPSADAEMSLGRIDLRMESTAGNLPHRTSLKLVHLTSPGAIDATSAPESVKNAETGAPEGDFAPDFRTDGIPRRSSVDRQRMACHSEVFAASAGRSDASSTLNPLFHGHESSGFRSNKSLHLLLFESGACRNHLS